MKIEVHHRLLGGRRDTRFLVVQTIRKHEDAILNWFKTKMTNGLVEAINGIIQAAKRKSRGFRTTRNLVAMIYLIGGKLKMQVD